VLFIKYEIHYYYQFNIKIKKGSIRNITYRKIPIERKNSAKMKRKKVISIFLLLFISLAFIHSFTYVNAWEIDDTGIVTYIVDGDTFDIASVGRIRLADINCPEVGELGADEATQSLESLIYNKEVYIDIDDIYGTGPYERIIAVVYVYYDDTHLKNVNQALLDAGHAEIMNYDNEFDPSTWTLLVEYDSGAPIWNPIPFERVAEYAYPFSYEVNAQDPSGIQSYWVNDTTDFQINDDGLITNKRTLSIGEHWIEVGALDPNGNMNSSTFKITVQDTIAPRLDHLPSTQYAEFTQPFSYELDVSDPSGIDVYWINDTSTFQIDENGRITNNTILPIEEYWLQIGVRDNFGNENSMQMKIIVQDTIGPTWTSDLSDYIIKFGTTFQCNITASDPSGIASYWINDTINFQIHNNKTIRNATALPVGIYWIKIGVEDSFGNENIKTIRIIVEDSDNKLNNPSHNNQQIFFVISLSFIFSFFIVYSVLLLRKFLKAF